MKKIGVRGAFAVATIIGVSIVGSQAFADRQPKMRDALQHLRAAEQALIQANDDKGGHRRKALRDVRQAIDHVQAGIAFDNRR